MESEVTGLSIKTFTQSTSWSVCHFGVQSMGGGGGEWGRGAWEYNMWLTYLFVIKSRLRWIVYASLVRLHRNVVDITVNKKKHFKFECNVGFLLSESTDFCYTYSLLFYTHYLCRIYVHYLVGAWNIAQKKDFPSLHSCKSLSIWYLTCTLLVINRQTTSIINLLSYSAIKLFKSEQSTNLSLFSCILVVKSTNSNKGRRRTIPLVCRWNGRFVGVDFSATTVVYRAIAYGDNVNIGNALGDENGGKRS